MSEFILRAVKAKHGDCLLLFAEGCTILVDGGPSGTYNRFLRDQLKALPPVGEDPAHIDMMMVSHIDADHIDGILDLTDELLEARDENRRPIVTIGRCWHNSFADDIMSATASISASARSGQAASLAGLLDEIDGPELDSHDAQAVLASVRQGRQLALDLKALNIDHNQRFKDRLAIQGHAPVWECGAMRVHVIGPSHEQIDDLRDKWAKELPKILAREADMASAAKSMDRSVSNLASIVAVAEVEDKRILLTGDARSIMILQWLEETGYLAAGGTCHFDIVKGAHHGSIRNVVPEFFERVTADHYLFCGDGKHSNPEPDTLDMLFTARPELNYKIHMTYGPDELKKHKDYRKHHTGNALDAVLAVSGRLATLNYPKEGETYLDITL